LINLELSNQYILGYAPTDEGGHKIKIRTKVGRIKHRTLIGGTKWVR